MYHWQHIYPGRKNNSWFSVIGSRLSPSTEHRIPNTESGFTLIELLIVLAIFSIVSIAVYATLSSGLRVWRRAQEVSIPERKDLLRIEKLSRELRQTFDFKDIDFYGHKDRLQLPAIVDADIVRVTYSFDADKKILFRSVDKLADILAAEEKNETLESKPLPYLSNVDKLSFSYFHFDLQKNGYFWKEDWVEQRNLPLAVKLDITVNKQSHATTIFIPIA